MIILLWNCRGAANSEFQIAFKDLCSFHKSQIAILTETEVSGNGASEVIVQLGFFKVEALDLSRGIFILWNQETAVNIIASNSQKVHMEQKMHNREATTMSATPCLQRNECSS